MARVRGEKPREHRGAGFTMSPRPCVWGEAREQAAKQGPKSALAVDAAAALVSINLNRRHLDTSQRAMIAARFATMPVGSPGNRPKSAHSSQSNAEAAALVNVGKEVVKDARTVIASATPDVIAKVERGEVSVSRAAKVTVPAAAITHTVGSRPS